MRISALLAVVLLAPAGCAYHGSAKSFRPVRLERETSWIAVRGVPLVSQAGTEDCGAAALAMVAGFWQPPVTLEEMAAALPPSQPASAKELRDVLRSRGLQAFVVAGDLAGLRQQLEKQRPVLVGVVKPYSRRRGLSHFEVVVGYDEKHQRVLTLDPAAGWRENSVSGFLTEWNASGRVAIVSFP